MSAIPIIKEELAILKQKLQQERENLKGAEENEREAQVAYDTAVRQHYVGAISGAEEEEARRAWSAATVNIDRLRRVVRMLEEQVAGKETELDRAEIGEATVAADSAHAEVRVLAERLLDKQEVIRDLRRQMAAVAERAAPHFQRIRRPMIDLEEELWQAGVACTRKRKEGP